MFKILKQKFIHRLPYIFSAVAAVIIIGISIHFVRAWTSPTAAPPSNNTAFLINASTTPQYKAGAFGVGGLFQADDNVYLATSTGKIGIGTTTPAEKLTMDGGNFLINGMALKEVGFIKDTTVLSAAESIYVSGKYAYIASHFSNTLSIFDISNPRTPTRVGYIKDEINAHYLGGAEGVYVSGKYAYVASRDDDSFTVIDISNPSQPVETGYAVNLTNASALEGAISVYVSGKYAYVVAEKSSSFTVFDISDPFNPKEASVLIDGINGVTGLGAAFGVYVSGKYAYVAARGGHLTVINISNPEKPVVLGSFTDTSSLRGADSVYVSGKYAYVTAYSTDTLAIIDISNPFAPSLAGKIVNGAGATALDYPFKVYVVGDYAYVPSYNDKSLSVFNISNPAAIKEVAVIKYDGNETKGLERATAVFVTDKYAYATSHTSTFSVIDISGIDAPTASIGSVSASTIEVTENMEVGNNLYANTGINAGPRGIKTDGGIQGSFLEVLNILKTAPTDTPGTCDAAARGAVYYDAGNKSLCYCDGTSWGQFNDHSVGC